MNYATIRNYDIANGEGVRTSLFVSGCTFHCPECFNPEQQDFNYGRVFTVSVMNEMLDLIADPVISGLSILGGDPMCQDVGGMTRLATVCDRVHDMGKTVWLWTGFTFEEVYKGCSSPAEKARLNLLFHCDIVVDGPFVKVLSDRALKWRGSANQRVIDVQKTLQQQEIILYER